MKTWIACLTLVLFASVASVARQSQSGPSFEEASVKPSAPQPMGMMRIGMNVDGAMARYTNVSLRDLIRSAYKVKDFQIDGPDWLNSARYDIVAKIPDGANKDQVPEMLQRLLADRFKLALHRDSKEHPIYALVVGKNGAKLKPAELQVADGTSPTSPAQPSGTPGGGAAPPPAPAGGATANASVSGPGRLAGGPPRGGLMFSVDPGGVHMKAPAATVANVADAISRFTERPIVDMTGIQGQYDFDMTFAPEKMPGIVRSAGSMQGPGGGEHTADAPAEQATSVFDALQAYGLKLEPRKAPMDVLIIDHIEKTPTEN